MLPAAAPLAWAAARRGVGRLALATLRPCSSAAQLAGRQGSAVASIDVSTLPRYIVLVRHGRAADLATVQAHMKVPSHRIPLTPEGVQHVLAEGRALRGLLTDGGRRPARLFCFTSPYLRCIQTTQHMLRAFQDDEVLGVQESVQLREQDWGNVVYTLEEQEVAKQERLRFGRFFYRFSAGESASDVFDRLTLFLDHFIRDCTSHRFAGGSVLIVTHGLTLRLWLMRWLKWTVDDFLQVHNAPTGVPIVLERLDQPLQRGGNSSDVKSCYRLTRASQAQLPGVSDGMCTVAPLTGRRQLLALRPYWEQVPQPPCHDAQQEAHLHELMKAGYEVPGDERQ